MSNSQDPRWNGLRIARVGRYDLFPEELEQGDPPDWIEFLIKIEYKNQVLFSRHIADPETLAEYPDLYKEILDYMVEKIDEGLDRIDEKEK